ncbi:hypothetical protein [uncultured Flavobacterium sp.]|uniref:hypothetical protein n=1 Tax=uncultured Flavobacterium sp. TaxID=165435 RepID=UPI0030CA250A
MKKIKIILFFVLIATLASCSGGIGDDLPGADYTNSPTIIGWGKPIVTESYFTDLGILNNTYPVNILGGGDGSPTTTDISVTISVDQAKTTAISGEYSIPSTTVTIPAGSKIGLVPINVNTASFSATEPTKVVLNVTTSSNGAVVSATENTQTINFVGCKSTIANYTYLMTVTSSTGAVYGPVIETVLMESVNSFMTYSAGTWNPPLNPGHGIRFEAICGTLSMPAHQGLVDVYSNDVTPIGTATVDQNGNFTLRYTIGFAAGPRDYTAVYIRQ